MITLSSKFILKVGKKGAIYLPKKIMSKLGISEGDKVIAKVEKSKIILEFLPDPIALALRIKKWSKVSVEEFEKESEKFQEDLYGS